LMILEKFTSQLGGKSVNNGIFLFNGGCCMQFCNYKNYFCIGDTF
jgi:hypothetical protein